MFIQLMILGIGLVVIGLPIYYHVVRGWHIVQLLKLKKAQIKAREEMMEKGIENPEGMPEVKELDVNDVMFA